MAGGRKVPGYAGRKFVGRRVLNAATPGSPRKHDAWAGLGINHNAVEIVNGSIRRRSAKPVVEDLNEEAA